MLIEEIKLKTVTELIGESYKSFKQGEHIILDCATGSGKTYFVLNVLGNWCKSNNKKILYLCIEPNSKERLMKKQ